MGCDWVDCPVAVRHQQDMIRGSVCRPREVCGPIDGVVLFITPPGREHGNVYHWVARCARRLASQGIASLRYHHICHPESSREPEDECWAKVIAGSRSASEWLANRVRDMPLSLIAVRSGALIARHILTGSIRHENIIYVEPLMEMEQVVRMQQIYDAVRGGRNASPHGSAQTGELLGEGWDAKGQEVTVISCTRSRMSVAASRAKRMLEMIGCRVTLKAVKELPFWHDMAPPLCDELTATVAASLHGKTGGDCSGLPNGGASIVIQGVSAWETHVVFPMGSEQLVGTVYRPLRVQHRDVGIVLCSGYRSGRNGPGELLVFLADHFARNGYACITFDYVGRGDSSGSPENLPMSVMARGVVAAMSELRKHANVESICRIGICAGAEAALWATVIAKCGGGPSVLMSVPSLGDRDRRKDGYRDIGRRLFARLQPHRFARGMYRVLNRDIHWRLLWHSIMGRDRSGSPTIFQALMATPVQNREPICFVSGGLDSSSTAAMKAWQGRLKALGWPCVQGMIVPGADHNYSDRECREALARRILSFLTSAARKVAIEG